MYEEDIVYQLYGNQELSEKSVSFMESSQFQESQP